VCAAQLTVGRDGASRAQALIVTQVLWKVDRRFSFSFVTLTYMGMDAACVRGRVVRAQTARSRTPLPVCTRARAVTLAFFTLPKLYEKNQAQCVQVLATAEAQLKVLFERCRSFL
jgi:hypothetical protein